MAQIAHIKYHLGRVIAVGTMDASAFREQERKDGKTNIYFNGPGDGPNHGHVVQQPGTDGQPVYDYVRDVEGDVYIDTSRY